MAFIFHNIYIYMGCHPSHWRTPSFFRGVGQPATSLMMWLYIVLFAFCSTNDSWGAFGFGSSANTAVALCNVMLLMCSEVVWALISPQASCIKVFFPSEGMVFPWWFVKLHVSLVLNDSYEFHTEFHTMLNIWETRWIGTHNFEPYLCVSSLNLVLISFVSAAEAEAHETLQGSLMWQGAGKFSGLVGPFVGWAICWNCCWKKWLPIIIGLLQPDNVFCWYFYQWNQILSCCDGLKSGTKPDIPKKWLTFDFGNCHAAFVLSQQCLGNQPDGKPVVAQQNGLLKKISPCHTMSALWKTYVHVFYFQDYGHV